MGNRDSDGNSPGNTGPDEGGHTQSGKEGLKAPKATQTDQSAPLKAEKLAAQRAYWRENIRLLIGLMLIWFACSFGAGIVLRDFLDQFYLGGYPLGFWFAQQGSIYIFIALIFFYVVRMKQIERKYDLDD